MNNSEMKEVNYKEYCPKCKHFKKCDFQDPCDECVQMPMREGTCVPERWEERK